MKKSSGTHEQYEQSNESEGIGKDNSRLQTIEGKVKQPSPKVVSFQVWHDCRVGRDFKIFVA